MHGVAPHMCGRVAGTLLGGGVGGRSPGFLLERYRDSSFLRSPSTIFVEKLGVGATARHHCQRDQVSFGKTQIETRFDYAKHKKAAAELNRVIQ